MAIGNNQVLHQQLRNRDLEDISGGNSTKINFYTIENFKDRGFLKEQTISVLIIKPLISNLNIVMTSFSKELSQKTIVNHTTGSSRQLTDRQANYTFTTETDVEFLNVDKKVLIATFENLEIDEAGDANQTVFFVQALHKAHWKPIEVKGNKNYNETDIQLIDVNDVVDNIQDCKLVYVFDDGKDWTDKDKSVDGAVLTLSNETLINKIMVRGVVNKGYTATDIKTRLLPSKKLSTDNIFFSLINLSPSSTNYKVSWYSHWLDPNRTLSYVKAGAFINSTKLSILFNKSNGDFAPWSQAQIDSALDCINSMIYLTFLYANNFEPARLPAKKGDLNQGQIDPNIKVYGNSLLDYVNKPEIINVDGIWESFLTKYPSSVDDSGMKVMLEVVQMLGRYINTTHTIGKGINRYNEVFLPWTFTIENKVSNNKDDLTVKLNSKYFEFKNGLDIYPKFLNASEYRVFDIGGWISQAELPDKITPLNGFANIGAVPTTNDNPLKYMFYLPYKFPKMVERLYGYNVSSSTIGWKDDGYKTITTDWIYVDNNYTRDKKQNFPNINNLKLENYIKVASGYRVKAGSISNYFFEIKTWDKENNFGPPTPMSHGQPVQYYTYTSKYKITLTYMSQHNGAFDIQTTSGRETLFDRGDLKRIGRMLTGQDKYPMYLEFWSDLEKTIPLENKLTPYKINEINIQGINFGRFDLEIDYVNKNITPLSFRNIKVPSRHDETITNLTILL